MRRLVRYELNRAFVNHWFVIALVLGCLFAVVCAITSYASFLGGEAAKLTPDEWLGLTSGGSYAQWMGVGSLDTLSLRYVFFMVAPLLAVMPYAWSYRSDVIDGTICQIGSRASAERRLFAKALAVFLTGFSVILIPYLLNFAILVCLVPSYCPSIVESLYLGISDPCAWSDLFYTKPLLYVVINSLANATLCGTWALVVLAVSFVVDNRVSLLAFPYVTLLVVQYLNNSVVFSVLGVGGVCLNLVSSLDCVALGSYVRTVSSLVAQEAAMIACVLVAFLLQRGRDLL